MGCLISHKANAAEKPILIDLGTGTVFDVVTIAAAKGFFVSSRQFTESNFFFISVDPGERTVSQVAVDYGQATYRMVKSYDPFTGILTMKTELQVTDGQNDFGSLSMKVHAYLIPDLSMLELVGTGSSHKVSAESVIEEFLYSSFSEITICSAGLAGSSISTSCWFYTDLDSNGNLTTYPDLKVNDSLIETGNNVTVYRPKKGTPLMEVLVRSRNSRAAATQMKITTVTR